jgi:precorrin-4 methylase
MKQTQDVIRNREIIYFEALVCSRLIKVYSKNFDELSKAKEEIDKITDEMVSENGKNKKVKLTRIIEENVDKNVT